MATITCPDCSFRFVPAKSKRVVVCPNCDCYDRTGEYLVDQKKRRAKELLIASQKRAAERAKLKTPPKIALARFSKKGLAQANAVSKAKREAKEEALEGGFVKCHGCGHFFDTIDGSHKVPLSQSHALAAVPGNIRLLCRSCHDKWEHGTIPKMIELRCFVEDMHFLLDMDPERYWKIHFRVLDEYNLRPTPALERVISKLESLDNQDDEREI